ncbi:MAG: HAD family phosphatase [Lunatimonas sp.]|uniref:HAD family hydrolase n=1 Tax=Lunatimonas sp. TaxID=2060141 RepID=UPI00263AFA12|nr:HAD family phosphatase [Lunatimonas sp.]MCC5936901.1 HAD family phosphatase [Lunatimonas sp.]
MKNTKDIKFLIFDLGNVIYDIDYSLTFNKLYSKLPQSAHEQVKEFMVSDIHYQLEMGKISEAAFRDGVRSYFGQEWEDAWIDEVWNALLVDIPQERLELLKKLKMNFGIYMLSNTNSIHFKVVERVFADRLGNQWMKLFGRLFLSHEMGLRKPDPAIYKAVVQAVGGKPEEFLFFDDLESNLEGAKSVGIQTHHVNHPKALIEFFAHV